MLTVRDRYLCFDGSHIGERPKKIMLLPPEVWMDPNMIGDLLTRIEAHSEECGVHFMRDAFTNINDMTNAIAVMDRIKFYINTYKPKNTTFLHVGGGIRPGLSRWLSAIYPNVWTVDPRVNTKWCDKYGIRSIKGYHWQSPSIMCPEPYDPKAVIDGLMVMVSIHAHADVADLFRFFRQRYRYTVLIEIPCIHQWCSLPPAEESAVRGNCSKHLMSVFSEDYTIRGGPRLVREFTDYTPIF